MDTNAVMESPFVIPPEDLQVLESSEGFAMLRGFLGGLDAAGWCDFHATASKQAQSTWLLHRDILHALVMPVVELFKRASSLAEAALCTIRSEDLELAFSGEARSAFLWLQCFLSEEGDWATTRGCPACVTAATLNTESHVRLVAAASLLSTSFVASPNSSPATSASSSPAVSPLEGPTQLLSTSPSLPALPIMPALRAALENDPFWGPDYWPYLFSRATQLCGDIHALITGIIDLESLVSSPSPTTANNPTCKRTLTTPIVQLQSGRAVEEKGVKLRKSKLAKRQLKMKGEEMELMRRCALQCWAKAAVPSKIRGEVLGLDKEKRVRSLTCP